MNGTTSEMKGFEGVNSIHWKFDSDPSFYVALERQPGESGQGEDRRHSEYNLNGKLKIKIIQTCLILGNTFSGSFSLRRKD